MISGILSSIAGVVFFAHCAAGTVQVLGHRAAALVIKDAFANCNRLLRQVTCGSLIKLQHEGTKGLLHSHEIAYGSGSGQQSVTGSFESDDANSMWIVRPQQVWPRSKFCFHSPGPDSIIAGGGLPTRHGPEERRQAAPAACSNTQVAALAPLFVATHQQSRGTRIRQSVLFSTSSISLTKDRRHR